MLGVDENDELIDTLKQERGEYNVKQSFAQMILDNLKTAGVQQAHKADRITFTTLVPWAGEGRVCAVGTYLEGDVEKRAGIFIGPEFGTVQRADLVEAARECGDAAFDVLIACAFNYEAHATEFSKLGRITTHAGMFTTLAGALAAGKQSPFEFAVVDEAQDISVAHLRFLAALGARRPDALFFAGDLGQRIFQQPFSWRSLGVDVRGRSRTLRINYRTSHQIRQHADRLLGPQTTDVDGIRETRSDTVSVFNGPPPVIRVLDSEGDEIETVATWLGAQSRAGVLPQEFGVFVRSPEQVVRATAAVNAAGLLFKVLDEHVDTTNGYVSISTMHLAKGLEFRAVVVMACDDEVVPLQERIETVGDDADLQEVYDTERHLLYVACTRARDYLLITAVAPASEFLDDFAGGD